MRSIFKSAIISGAGVVTLGTSLALSSASAVFGASAAGGNGLVQPLTCNTTGYCLSRNNIGSGGGIKGQATSGDGLYGQTASGDGVYGSSKTGAGVYGNSSSNYGVSGESPCSTCAGIYGASSNGAGVWGTSTNDTGSYGYSSSGDGGLFVSAAPYGSFGLLAWNTNAGGYPFAAANVYRGDAFTVDEYADGTFDGSVTAYGGFKTMIRSRGGEPLGASVAMMPQATMEDTGTGRLFSGEGAVRFDPAFASTIDANRGYQVFLTPDGDTRGLYVAAKYENGFIVREVERGRSSLDFDYRVVAHPHGVSDARLPRLTIRPLPRPKLPAYLHQPDPSSGR